MATLAPVVRAGFNATAAAVSDGAVDTLDVGIVTLVVVVLENEVNSRNVDGVEVDIEVDGVEVDIKVVVLDV